MRMLGFRLDENNNLQLNWNVDRKKMLYAGISIKLELVQLLQDHPKAFVQVLNDLIDKANDDLEKYVKENKIDAPTQV